MTYCTPDDVAAELGVTFDGEQEARAATLIAAAQAFIDTYCMCTFEASTPITGEWHALYGQNVYLDVAPIASVEAVRWRVQRVGEPYHTLTGGHDYEVVDFATGHLRLRSHSFRTEVTVDYTPAVTVPADIADVTAQIVAERMSGTIPSSSGADLPGDVKRVRVGTELEIERFTEADVPEAALDILTTLRLHQKLVFV